MPEDVLLRSMVTPTDQHKRQRKVPRKWGCPWERNLCDKPHTKRIRKCDSVLGRGLVAE